MPAKIVYANRTARIAYKVKDESLSKLVKQGHAYEASAPFVKAASSLFDSEAPVQVEHVRRAERATAAPDEKRENA